MPFPLLKFKPVLLPKPWGGEGLWRLLGKGFSTDTGMGESWELSDRPEAPSLVAEGPFQGESLGSLLARHGREIVGPNTEAHSFPLLYKFISAREKLSVQVHPGEGSPLGDAKTECWVVLDAVPGAELIVGLKTGHHNRPTVLELLQSPRCEEVLRRWPAKRGDVFFIPAGTVHAITEGLLLYEVQQNSDTTFRLYDWGRKDSSGKARALHLEDAAQVSDLAERDGFQISPLRIHQASHVEEYLVACAFFALVKWHQFRDRARLQTRGRFRVITVMSGSLDLVAASGQTMPVKTGDTVLVPADQPSVDFVSASADAECIVSFVPDVEKEVFAPLVQAGWETAQINALAGPQGFP